MAAMFALDPAFPATSHAIGDLPLCAARLQDDGRYPWIVLIPRRPGLTELEALEPADQALLMIEIIRAGQAVRSLGAAMNRPVEKLNVGALGNITRQLHIHVVGRRADDFAWPGPVWGQGTPEPYGADDLPAHLARLRTALAL